MKLTAAEVMTTPVVSIDDSATIDDACAKLLRHHISGLPIVDDENRLLGVISEFDLLRLLYDPETTMDHVLDYASTDVVTVREDMPLPEVVEIFLSRPFRRLPVVDADNRLVGVVSRRDVLRRIREVRLSVASALHNRRRAATAAAGYGH